MDEKSNSQMEGVTINAGGNATIGGDVVGRDKNTTVNNYYLGLEFLEKFISDATQEKLKPSVSKQTAQSKAFRLYQVLGEVNQKTEAFVEALSAGIDSKVAQTPPQPDSLAQRAHELMEILPELAEALDGVNPQLEIHRYELVQQIIAYRTSRAQVLTDLEKSTLDISSEPGENLQRILETAKQNRALIRQATDELRKFLAEMFPFKESFE